MVLENSVILCGINKLWARLENLSATTFLFNKAEIADSNPAFGS